MLPVPTPQVTPGPQWASQINACITELQQVVSTPITNSRMGITDADVKHGTRIVRLGIVAGRIITGGATIGGGNNNWFLAATSSDVVAYEPQLAENDRLLEVTAFTETAVGGQSALITLSQLNIATGAASVLANTSVIVGVGTLAITISQIVTSVPDMVFRVTWLSNQANNKLFGMRYKFDKVATP